jgi:hypothetical protein
MIKSLKPRGNNPLEQSEVTQKRKNLSGRENTSVQLEAARRGIGGWR